MMRLADLQFILWIRRRTTGTPFVAGLQENAMRSAV